MKTGGRNSAAPFRQSDAGSSATAESTSPPANGQSEYGPFRPGGTRRDQRYKRRWVAREKSPARRRPSLSMAALHCNEGGLSIVWTQRTPTTIFKEASRGQYRLCRSMPKWPNTFHSERPLDSNEVRPRVEVLAEKPPHHAQDDPRDPVGIRGTPAVVW